MIKSLKYLSLLCFLTLASPLNSKINLDEINPYVASLAEHYNLQSAHKGQSTLIEFIDLTIRLLEKSYNDHFAEQISQEINSSMHKYLPLLTQAIAFEKNYNKVSDTAEELFKYETKTKSETSPKINPFRLPLTYAILVISKIALLQEQNPDQEFSQKQMENLKIKLRQSFKNIFYNEKTNLKNHPYITSKNINEFCDAIDLLIPTKNSPSLLNPFNWNFGKMGTNIAAIIGITCGVALTVSLIRTLTMFELHTQEATELNRKISNLIGNPGMDPNRDEQRGTLSAYLTNYCEIFGRPRSVEDQPGTIVQGIRDFGTVTGASRQADTTRPPQQGRNFIELLSQLIRYIETKNSSPEQFWGIHQASNPIPSPTRPRASSVDGSSLPPLHPNQPSAPR